MDVSPNDESISSRLQFIDNSISPDKNEKVDNILHEKNGIDRYEIHVVHGRGGMGNIYYALDRYTKIKVRIKTPNPKTIFDIPEAEANREAFKKEAEALARLGGNKHIMAILDYSSAHFPGDPEGTERPFIVMRDFTLDRSHTLNSEIWRKKKLDIHEALNLVSDIGEALDEGHKQNPPIIHGDVKPGNIINDKHYGSVLIDYGNVGMLNTGNGSTAGTLEYMSPEAMLKNGIVDDSSDRYSLGMTLFEALTGKLPYEMKEDRKETMIYVLKNPPDLTPLSELYGDNPHVLKLMTEFFERVLSKDKSLRPASGKEMTNQFKEIVRNYDLHKEITNLKIETIKERFDRLRPRKL